MSNSQRVIALVMAAGRSSRFGTDKRLALLPCGNMILTATLDKVCSTFDKTYLITSKHDKICLGDAYENKIERLASNRSLSGLGYSIADGVKQITSIGETADALIVILADMPLVATSTYRSLIDTSAAGRIIRPSFRGKPGNPVSFGRDFWQELSKLNNTEGARSLLKLHANNTHNHSVNDPGILFDIDTPSDIHESLDYA